MVAAMFVQYQTPTVIWGYVWLGVVATMLTLGGIGVVRAWRKPSPATVNVRLFSGAIVAVLASTAAQIKPITQVVIEGIACCDYYWWLLFFCWPESWGC